MMRFRIARQGARRVASRSAAAALAVVVAACAPADVPGGVPAPVAPNTAEEAGLHASQPAPASDAACRQRDTMLSGMGYGEARMRLQAAGYRVEETAGEAGHALAGDAAACDSRSCIVDYVADGEEPLRLTVAIDASRADDEWRIDAWSSPSCRPAH
jgi:hypothetical protein